MLTCPSCNRTGGPFGLCVQFHADSHALRGWSCPCGKRFHAIAGAEHGPHSQPTYSGFQLEWNGQQQSVHLIDSSRHVIRWEIASWTLIVARTYRGSGTCIISMQSAAQEQIGQWRLQAGWSASEIRRQLKPWPPQVDLELGLVARALARMLK